MFSPFGRLEDSGIWIRPLSPVYRYGRVQIRANHAFPLPCRLKLFLLHVGQPPYLPHLLKRVLIHFSSNGRDLSIRLQLLNPTTFTTHVLFEVNRYPTKLNNWVLESTRRTKPTVTIDWRHKLNQNSTAQIGSRQWEWLDRLNRSPISVKENERG